MQKCQTLFRSALLGSALALVAMAPAISADASRADQKRALALHGKQSVAALSKAGGASGSISAKSTYTVLHNFAGGANDGSGSGANVTLDDAGNIYGTTDYGGANGDGTVFKLAPDGTQTVLYSFTGGTDGSAPDGGVVVLANGDIYGSTGSGGAGGNGTIFKLSSKGKLKVLHALGANDGSFIRGDLFRDSLGNLYGTALFGGVNGDGTVFKYGFDGTFTVLHAFNETDGQYPEHGVVGDKDGNLYGVTAFGGASGEGTVYKIDSKGNFTTLYSFTGGADGGFLYGGLDVDAKGNVYGSTVDGGASGAGTVFEISSKGTLATLYNFTGGADGSGPEGDMLLVGKNLYSTTDAGGDPTCQCGTIFEVTSKGKAKVLHAFTGGSSDGGGYSAGLALSNNILYGTTQSYGANGDGIVFSASKK